jgi:hypothetical protein
METNKRKISASCERKYSTTPSNAKEIVREFNTWTESKSSFFLTNAEYLKGFPASEDDVFIYNTHYVRFSRLVDFVEGKTSVVRGSNLISSQENMRLELEVRAYIDEFKLGNVPFMNCEVVKILLKAIFVEGFLEINHNQIEAELNAENRLSLAKFDCHWVKDRMKKWHFSKADIKVYGTSRGIKDKSMLKTAKMGTSTLSYSHKNVDVKEERLSMLIQIAQTEENEHMQLQELWAEKRVCCARFMRTTQGYLTKSEFSRNRMADQCRKRDFELHAIHVFLCDKERETSPDPVDEYPIAVRVSVDCLSYLRTVYHDILKNIKWCDFNRTGHKRKDYDDKLLFVVDAERKYCAILESRTNQLRVQLANIASVASYLPRGACDEVNKATERLEVARDQLSDAKQRCVDNDILINGLKAACFEFERLFVEAGKRLDSFVSMIERVEKYSGKHLISV